MKILQKIEADPFLKELGLHEDRYRLPYRDITRELNAYQNSREDLFYELLAETTEQDFYLFCWCVLGLPVNNPFLLSRAYEIQDNEGKDGLYLWSREHWKALSFDTPVMTSQGWKKHGELKVGDKVIGSSGEYVNIVARTPDFVDADLYEIEFNHKYRIVASSNHLWEVEKKSRRRISGTKNKRVGREKVIMTSEEIFKHGFAQDNRLSLESVCVKYRQKKYPIPPYLLGVWLGDGHSAGGRITGQDSEVFEKIEELGYKVHDTSKDITKSIHGIVGILKKLNVFKNKHIPEEYKIGSIDQRLELVRGLMDTDGTINSRGTATFTNINKELCEGLYEVLVSLGLNPSIREHKGKSCSADYIFYNVSFNPRKEMNPFHIKRKADRVKFENKPKRRFITGVKTLKKGSHKVNCITVDALDGIYLAGKEMIKTHNSTLLTFALRLWKLVRRPEITQALFSNSIKLARPHFNLIKRTCETNLLLKRAWPHIFWDAPQSNREATWSLESGLFFKTTKGKDPGLGAYGLIDSMPTGGHFNEKVTDDLVDLNNVGTSFMMDKVKEAFRMSDNLGSEFGGTVDTVIGTRYRYMDLYEELEASGVYRVSIIPAEVDDKGGPKFGGYPVFMSKESLDKKKIKQGSNYYAQMLQTPLQAGTAAFKQEWLKFKDSVNEEGHYYILADAASNPELSKTPDKLDFTCFWLIKTQPGRKIKIVDCVKDRIGLKEKWNILKQWHVDYNIELTAYEEYGPQKDSEFFLIKMDEERFYFHIKPLRENKKEKSERIGILREFFSEEKIILPKSILRLTKARGVVDLISEFIDEYLKYPMTEYDDMLDSLSKISEVDLLYPNAEEEAEEEERYYQSPLEEEEGSIECFWGGL
jgi:hypothetical protein